MNKLLSSLCSRLHLKPEHTELLNERDTSDVWRQFAIWFLVDEDHGVIRFTKPGTPQYNAIVQVAQLYINDCKDIKMWQEAYDAVWFTTAETDADNNAVWCAAKAAFYAAYSTAWYAAYYDSTDAADAAFAAADAAAYAACANCAAKAAYYAAKAAYYAATTAAEAAAYAAHYERMADKLIELINAAPMMK